MNVSNMQAKSIIEYRRIYLPKTFDFDIRQDFFSLGEFVQQFLGEITNEPVELFGSSSLFFLFALYGEIKDTVTDVVYREHEGGNATAIYSMVDFKSFFRPYNVKKIVEWADEELDELDLKREKDQAFSLELDLSEIWNKAKNKEDPKKSFLQEIYQINPSKDLIQIRGEAPLDLALLALDWFLDEAKSIYYYTLKLK